ncbi:MAG: hypothetical protein ACXVH2_00800 [Methanobacterium sp.]
MTKTNFKNKLDSKLGFIKGFVDRTLQDNEKQEKIKQKLMELQQLINQVNQGDFR